MNLLLLLPSDANFFTSLHFITTVYVHPQNFERVINSLARSRTFSLDNLRFRAYLPHTVSNKPLSNLG